MSESVFEGGCQCGNIRYIASGTPVITAICHCSKCRRAHAAPAVAWAIFPDAQFRFTGQQPKFYRSSEIARRGFCPECGSQIVALSEAMPGLVDISIGSLDDPESVAPAFHIWHANHLSWAEFADTLPRHAGFPPDN